MATFIQGFIVPFNLKLQPTTMLCTALWRQGFQMLVEGPRIARLQLELLIFLCVPLWLLIFNCNYAFTQVLLGLWKPINPQWKRTMDLASSTHFLNICRKSVIDRLKTWWINSFSKEVITTRYMLTVLLVFSSLAQVLLMYIRQLSLQFQIVQSTMMRGVSAEKIEPRFGHPKLF